jgi:hypothetical protein
LTYSQINLNRTNEEDWLITPIQLVSKYRTCKMKLAQLLSWINNIGSNHWTKRLNKTVFNFFRETTS